MGQTTTTKEPPESKSVFSAITVEPIVFCYILGLVVTLLATQNLHLEKACRVNLKMDSSVCDALKYKNVSLNKTNEEDVQKVVASALVWKNLLYSFFSVLILAFVGSWSDRNDRRKIFILLPLSGEIVTVLLLLACTYFFYWPMEVTVASEILPGLFTGGNHVFMFAVFTIICSKTKMEDRTVRVGVVHVVFQLGLTIGLAASGVLLQNLGHYGVYALTLSLYLIGVSYAGFFVRENSEKDVGSFREFFDFKSLRNTLEVIFKNEDKRKQTKIHLIMVVVCLVAGPLHGELGVIYLYTRYKFEWNEVDFGIFFSCCAIIHLTAASISLAIFSKWLKMDDTLIGCLAAASKIGGSLVYAFAPSGFIFYLGIAADVLSSVLFIAMRSIVSKQVPADKLGKMNSIFGLAESLVPLLFGPLYSATYKWTISIFPGTFYILSSIFALPVLAIFVWLYLNRTAEDENAKEEQEVEKMVTLLDVVA